LIEASDRLVRDLDDLNVDPPERLSDADPLSVLGRFARLAQQGAASDAANGQGFGGAVGRVKLGAAGEQAREARDVRDRRWSPGADRPAQAGQ
jgi:hypothetical protein